MKSSTTLALGMTLAISSLAAVANTAFGATSMAHKHMGHVITARQGTPDGKGYIPTAIDAAKVAVKHAGIAASKPADLAWMKDHTGDVLKAVAPKMGVGVLQAAEGAVKHINLAANSKDASKNVHVHAVHVAASSQNVANWSKEIVDHGNEVLAATDAATAAEHLKPVVMLTSQLLGGVDANGDGKTSWQAGEGGLMVAQKHMGFMVKGENMN